MIHGKKTGIGHRPQFVASWDFKKVLGYIFPMELLFLAFDQEHLLGKHDLGVPPHFTGRTGPRNEQL